MAPTQGEGKRVAVVGGGVAGLAAAYELTVQARERGLPLSLDLFDSSDRLGGSILTERVDDYVLDAGPDAVLTLKPWGLELCREIGLEDEIIPTQDEHRGVALYSRGALRSLPYGKTNRWPTSSAGVWAVRPSSVSSIR